MKKCVPHILLGVLISTLCVGQSADWAWVKVKTDYGMGRKIDTIRFFISDGYTARTVNATGDENGTFLAGFDISNSIDITWSFRKNKVLPLIISPNDTLQITILSESDGVLFGKRARTCSNLVDMFASPTRPPVYVNESEYATGPREFVEFMNDRLNDHLKFANSFCKSRKCTKTFVTWYIKSAYVSYYKGLAEYCQVLQRKASLSATNYNHFVRSRNSIMTHIDLNDPTLEMSSGYYDMLRSIFTLFVTPDELKIHYYVKASEILLGKPRGLSASDQQALQRIQTGSFSNADVSVLTKLSQRFKREVSSAMKNPIDPVILARLSEIQDPDIRQVIIAYYKGIWAAI